MSIEHLLLGQQNQCFVLDDRTSELQISEQFGSLIGTDHSLERSEKTRGVFHQRCEDELITRLLVLGTQIQSKGVTFYGGIRLLNLSV